MCNDQSPVFQVKCGIILPQPEECVVAVIQYLIVVCYVWVKLGQPLSVIEDIVIVVLGVVVVLV